MNIDQLIHLANRIGDFFDAMPDRAEGVEGVANHIEKFWEPRMRRQILEFLVSNPEGRTAESELSPITLEALNQHRDRLIPKA